jgi:4'-phosphopantetheinyl transferase
MKCPLPGYLRLAYFVRVLRKADPVPVHVTIFLCVPEHQSADEVALATSVLDAKEIGRANRFVFPQDHLAFVVAHGLLRLVLARYAHAPAAELRFLTTAHGRPELQVPAGPRRLRFNLSHSRGLVGCAVAFDRDIGFDVERLRLPAPLEVADSYFSREELRELHRLHPARQPDRFYTLWTLKEAYLKARGVGLGLPLDSFSILPAGTTDAYLSPLAPSQADARPWTLRHWRLAQHRAALALQVPRALPRVALFEDQRLGALEFATLSPLDDEPFLGGPMTHAERTRRRHADGGRLGFIGVR